MIIPLGIQPYLHFDASANDLYIKQVILIFIWLKNIFYLLKNHFKN